jgi:hypothetical protein
VQRVFIKKYFLFTVGSVCRMKRFSLGGKRFTDDKEVDTEVRKWLSTAVKRLQCWWRICREISVYFQVRISLVSHFISICDLFTGCSSYIYVSKNRPEFYKRTISAKNVLYYVFFQSVWEHYLTDPYSGPRPISHSFPLVQQSQMNIAIPHLTLHRFYGTHSVMT